MAKKTAWLFCLCILLISLAEARAQTYSLSTDSTADLLTISFPKNAPPPVVLRTGAKRVEVLFPAGTKLKGVSGGTVRGRHIVDLSVADNVLVVDTEGAAFGFAATSKGDKAIQLKVFYDPAGSSWQAQAPPQEAKQKPEQPPAQPAKSQEASKQTPSVEAKGVASGQGVTGKVEFPEPQVPQPAPPDKPTQQAQANTAPGQQPAAAGPQPGPSPAPPAPAASQPQPIVSPSQGVTGKIESSATQAPTPAQPQPTAPASQAPALALPQSDGAPGQAAKAPDQPLAPSQPSGQPGTKPDKPGLPAPGEVRGSINPQASAQPVQPPAQKTGPPPAPEGEKAKAEETAAAPENVKQETLPPKEEPKEPAKDEALDDKVFFTTGEQALAKGDYDKALQVANELLAKPELAKDLREGALYIRAEVAFALNKNLAEHFIETSDIIQQALNFNTNSPRLPRALIKLGYINLRQGNLPEAKAYFNLLRNRYPLDEDVPLIDLYWGEYYMDQAKLGDAKANYERAAQSFKEVLQKYPESRFARDAALGLSRAQVELHQYAEASKIIDYIDKRWPRYYVENPVMRRVTADIAYKLGEYEKAKDDYLWFYNLVPTDPSNDLVLARLGDVTVKLGKMEAAREYYDRAIRLFPGKEGALMAMMRLGEQGIHDAPTLQEMFKAFADPKDVKPDKIYEIIVNEYPKSALAPLALLKLAMWKLYKQEYSETLDLVKRFITSYPGDELEKQAVEVGAQAFGKMLDPLLEQMDYKRILELWRSYPFLAGRGDLFSDRDRLGVALTLYYQGAPKEALALVEPYLDKGSMPDSQKALALMLTIYRENQDWQAILDTLRKVSSWKLSDNPRRALEFAQAMALEHTGDYARSRLLWARLAADNQLDPAKRAYAVYYQARTAYDRKDYDKALLWAMDSRTLFREAAKDDGKARDALLLMIEANQAAGRFNEALELCDTYEKEAPENSAEWAANRLRMAALHRSLGDLNSWKKILVDMRDSLGDSLYGKLAASELATKGLEERAGKIAGPP